jgi:hypothetical protein
MKNNKRINNGRISIPSKEHRILSNVLAMVNIINSERFTLSKQIEILQNKDHVSIEDALELTSLKKKLITVDINHDEALEHLRKAQSDVGDYIPW